MTDLGTIPTEAHIRLNPNRVVAYNLKRARVLRRMTQEQAAAALEVYLGTSWAKQTFSMAERAAYRPNRVRRFDAAEIAAFAQAFNLPVGWFFMPPRVVRDGDQLRLEIPFDLSDEPGVEVVDMVDSILRTDNELDARIEYAVDSERDGYRGLADELECRKGKVERRQRDRDRALALRTPAEGSRTR